MREITDDLSRQLEKARYRVRTGEELGARPIRFVASKIKGFPAWIPIAMLSTHIVVLEKDKANPQDIQNLFDIGFGLAKRINRIPLLRGMQFGYAVIPIVVGRDPDAELLRYAAAAPRRHWALFEFPVVVDLTKYEVAFFEGLKTHGALIWPILQEIIIKHVEPLIDASVQRRQPRLPRL